jgi:hypothetical protein
MFSTAFEEYFLRVGGPLLLLVMALTLLVTPLLLPL